jgi:hypothetical protein
MSYVEFVSNILKKENNNNVQPNWFIPNSNVDKCKIFSAYEVFYNQQSKITSNLPTKLTPKTFWPKMYNFICLPSTKKQRRKVEGKQEFYVTLFAEDVIKNLVTIKLNEEQEVIKKLVTTKLNEGQQEESDKLMLGENKYLVNTSNEIQTPNNNNLDDNNDNSSLPNILSNISILENEIHHLSKLTYKIDDLEKYKEMLSDVREFLMFSSHKAVENNNINKPSKVGDEIYQDGKDHGEAMTYGQSPHHPGFIRMTSKQSSDHGAKATMTSKFRLHHEDRLILQNELIMENDNERIKNSNNIEKTWGINLLDNNPQFFYIIRYDKEEVLFPLTTLSNLLGFRYKAYVVMFYYFYMLYSVKDKTVHYSKM